MPHCYFRQKMVTPSSLALSMKQDTCAVLFITLVHVTFKRRVTGAYK